LVSRRTPLSRSAATFAAQRLDRLDVGADHVRPGVVEQPRGGHTAARQPDHGHPPASQRIEPGPTPCRHVLIVLECNHAAHLIAA
jgi:hypothetical protein